MRLEEEEPVEDELPTSGPGGARNLANSQAREGGEKFFKSPGNFEKRPPFGTTSGEKRGSSVISEQEYRSSPASDFASFFEMFPDARRIGFSYWSGQFDEERHDRRTARHRRIAADAASNDAGESLGRCFLASAASGLASGRSGVEMWANIARFLYLEGFAVEAVARILETARAQGLDPTLIARVIDTTEREELWSLH